MEGFGKRLQVSLARILTVDWREEVRTGPGTDYADDGPSGIRGEAGGIDRAVRCRFERS